MKTSGNKEFFATILLSTIFMGSSFPAGKYLISNISMPPFYLGGWRFLIAGIIMLAIVVMRNGVAGVIPSSNGSVVKGFAFVFSVGCLQTAGTMGFLNLALETLSSSMSSIIIFTNPLWLAILAHVYLNERISGRKVVALLLGIIGVAYSLGVDGTESLRGLLFALTGSLCWSLCTLISKKNTFDKSVFVFTGWQLLLGALVMLAVSRLLGEEFHVKQMDSWALVWFFWLVIPASIGSFGLWFKALSLGGATLTSCYLFLVPLFSAIFSITLLRESLSQQVVIGSSLIISSLWFINRGGNLTAAKQA